VRSFSGRHHSSIGNEGTPVLQVTQMPAPDNPAPADVRPGTYPPKAQPQRSPMEEMPAPDNPDGEKGEDEHPQASLSGCAFPAIDWRRPFAVVRSP
jgi:hypothetical protein